MINLKKFSITPCSKNNGELVIGLSPIDDENMVIFFPINEEDGNLINFILDPEKNNITNEKLLNLYKTMMDGFESSGVFLSGIIIDTITSKENNEDLLHCLLILSKIEGGSIENTMAVSFNNALILSAFNGMEIFITGELLEKILNRGTFDENGNDKNVKEPSDKKQDSKKFPVDKKIGKIAKRIMDGKIK